MRGRTLPLPFPGNLWLRCVSHIQAGLFALFSAPSGRAPRQTDLDLVREALAGGAGFERLVRCHERMVYRVAFRFLGNEPDALDLAQEVFIRIHRSLHRFRAESSLSTWIYAVTANLARNALRSKRNREKFQVLAPPDREEGPGFWEKAEDVRGAAASRGAENRELSEALARALSRLPTDFKEAVILRDLEGLDYQDIALALRLGLGTVKSRIARGRSLLRDALKEWL